MPRVIISTQTLAAIRLHVRPGFNFASTAEPTRDGGWSIYLSSDVMRKLKEIKSPMESMDDVISRVCATAGKGLN